MNTITSPHKPNPAVQDFALPGSDLPVGRFRLNGVEVDLDSTGHSYDDEGSGVAAMNSIASVVRVANSVRILIEEAGELLFLSEKDGRTYFANWTYIGGTANRQKLEPVFTAWLRSPGRRTYQGVGFYPDPTRKPPNHLNLWKGLPVKPQTGSWRRVQRHLLTVLCGGDVKLYGLLLAFLAQIVQQPGEKVGVALVIPGGKGAGKSTLTGILRQLFGRHLISISQEGHFSGRFNAHREKALVVVVEEAIWGGDPKVDGIVKEAITGSTMMLERKGVDAVEVPDHSRFIFVTNSTRAIPATAHDRRYLVLDTNNLRIGDGPYFEALYGEINASGAGAAMLADLLELPWQDYPLRTPPMTRSLSHQIASGLNPSDGWWWSVLKEGALFGEQGMDLAVNETERWEDEAATIPKEVIYEAYRLKVRGRAGGEIGEAEIARWLRGRVPSLREVRPRLSDGSRPRCFVFPPLSVLRGEFTAGTGITCDAEADWDVPGFDDRPLVGDRFFEAAMELSADAESDLLLHPHLDQILIGLDAGRGETTVAASGDN